MLAYCDYIASEIREALVKTGFDSLIGGVGPVKMDLHPVEGYFQSTTKTIEVIDTNGKYYKVTVEEVS